MMYNERLRVVVDEIRKSINQVFDDANITPSQVTYWIRIAANKLLSQHIAKRSSGAYLSTFDNIPVLIASISNNPSIVKNRKFIQLPGEIFDFDGDRGVEYFSYTSDGGVLCPPRFTQVTFTRTTFKQSHWLYKSPHTTPSPSNPYWYRTKHNIYLLGVEKINVPTIEMGAYMTINPIEMLDVNYDDQFEFPAELMETLKMSVLTLARMSYMFPVESRENSGGQELENKPNTAGKIQSVNQSQAEQ